MATNRNRVGTSVNGLMSSSPFLGGLNTELAGIVDSTDFTKDECNMIIRADGSRSRRPGVDYEEGYFLSRDIIDTSNNNLAFNSIEWSDYNSPDEANTHENIPYLVVQVGSKIIFYRNHGEPYSQDQASFVLDLLSYKITGRTDDEVATSRCKFTKAYGCLFITSEAIKPIRLRRAQTEEESVPAVVFPECTVSCASLTHRKTRLGTWTHAMQAFVEFYFNDLLIGKYIVDVIPGVLNPVPNSYTLAQYFNSLPAEVRRHITAVPFEQAPNVWTNPIQPAPSWSPADWITFKASRLNEKGLKISIKIDGWALSGKWWHTSNQYTAYMVGGSSAYTNSTGLELAIRDTDKGAEDYIAIDESPSKLSYAHLYNLLNQGWTTTLIAKFYVGSSATPALRIFPGNNLAQQYLKDVKTNAFKPQDLINMTFGNTPAAKGHIILDFFYQDRNSVAGLDVSMQDIAGEISTLTGVPTTVDDILDNTFPIDPTSPSKQVPVVKPRKDFVADICAYAGRIFYLCGDVLLYSQMISEDVDKADRCYTEADPTSEEMSDIVETDGGLISLPDIGDGIRLAQYGQYLFIFGTRGNAVITGTANNIFTATAYSAGALNVIPTQAPDSFVNTEFGVFYWGTTGIVALGAGENGVGAQDISTEKILTWYGRLSNTQHQWCKGVYSSSKKRIYWFYPSNDEKPRRLDCCLVYDIQRGSFYPQQVAIGEIDETTEEFVETDVPEIVSGLSLKTPFKLNREYPVIASAKNFVDISGDFIKIGKKLDLKKNGCIFRLDMSGLDNLAVGESQVLVRYCGVPLYTAVRLNDTQITVNKTLDNTTQSGVFYNYSKIWTIMYYKDGYTNVCNDVESNFPDGDYSSLNTPEDFGTHYQTKLYKVVDSTKGYVEIYKPVLGEITGSYCEADFDTVNSVITGRYNELDDNPDVYLEVGEEVVGQLKYNMRGYRDASHSLEYTTEQVDMLTATGDNRKGALFRCDLSAFDDMENGTSQDLIKIRQSSTGSVVETITLSKSALGDYSFTYSGSGSTYGSFSSDEVIWFAVWNSWESGDTVLRLNFGYCEESLLDDSGYTAQNLPDAAIPYFKVEYLDNYTDPGVYYEFVTKMLGDYSIGFSNMVVDTAQEKFISRSGELTPPQEYYYEEIGEETIYTFDGSDLYETGVIRNMYGTDYVDLVLNSTRNYPRYTYNGVSYYLGGNLVSETAPVFVLEDSELVLFGFTTDNPTTSSITFTAYNDSTPITATFADYLDDQQKILVLAKYSDNDQVINLNVTNNLINILADEPIDSEEFTYESSILVCLDTANMKITFGDFRNNLLKDWTAGDWNGDGYNFESYLISHPMNATTTSSFTGRRVSDTVHTKNMPYLITYFRRTETGSLIDGEYIYPSACQGSVLWDWRTSGRYGKWSSPTELYRPYRKTILDNGYVINKTNVRGLGRSYQVKLESVESKQFILEGLVYDLKNDGRI